MNGLHELKRDIRDCLATRPDFRNMRLLCEYGEARRVPVEEDTVVVGIDSVELCGAGLGGYLGEATGEAGGGLYGPAALITLRLDIWLPGRAGAERCHAVYELLCGALLQAAGRFGLTRLWCDAPGFDSDTRAGQLRAYASLRAALTGEERYIPIEQFQVRSDYPVDHE